MAKGQPRKGQPRRRGKLMSEAEFKRLWHDHTVHIDVIAATLDVTRQAVAVRAAVRGYPSRKGQRAVRPRIEEASPRAAAEIRAMWSENVGLKAMAEHFNCCHTAVLKAAARLKLPKRHLSRWHMITVAEFRALQVRRQMEAMAKADQEAATKFWRAA